MKKANTILLLLMLSFSMMSFSCTTSKTKTIHADTVSTLKQYVGDYVHDSQDLIIRIYTK